MPKSEKISADSNRMKWFLYDRFGMFIHWGLYAIPARGEWVRYHEKISNEDYQKYFNEFNPVRYNPAAWAKIAKNAGQKYVVMTAKHHDGFCLFDSKFTDYKATNTPIKRDLIAEYVKAFRSEGLKVGFYYSLLDWHHPDYPTDKFHPMRENEELKKKPRDFSRYVEYMHNQVRELLSNYGKIDIMWFDFSYDNMSGETWKANELVKMVSELQPHIIIDNRLTTGHTDLDAEPTLGDFVSPEQIIPPEGVKTADGRPIPWESCITFNENWGYVNHPDNYKTPRDVIRTLVECVSKNGNLILNVGPNAYGEIPLLSVKVLEAVGEWMKVNSESIYGCGSVNLSRPDWGRLTRKGNIIYAHIFEMPISSFCLPGMAGKIKKARLLIDGSEVPVQVPWNASEKSSSAFFQLWGRTLPDPIDTVVQIELEQL